MATRDDIYQAIRNADKAGDSESVRNLGAYLQTMPVDAPVQQPEQSMGDKIAQGAGNLAAGAVRGAGSIGATILYPYDKIMDQVDKSNGVSDTGLKGLVTGEKRPTRNEQRRSDMDSGLQMMGAEPNSLLYKGGKLAGEIAGTAGAGGVVANGARIAGASPALVSSISSGGFLAPGANMLTRALGGAASGAAQAAMVDPSTTLEGAALGGALPGAAKLAGMAGNKLSGAISSSAESLMQSAIKPTIKQLREGDAATAVRTLLDNGINPTKGGVNKLREMIDGLNTQIADKISTSGATIPKQNVMNALDDVRNKFTTQVAPQNDLAAIQGVADNFTAHPSIPGNDIPVQLAQDMKQGTYRVLAKKYGQLGSAETEAQKGLARGLKDEIATAVPGVGALNAEESKLLTTLSVAERRALMDLNKNPMGLAALAGHPAGWAAFMADRSVTFKALAARLANTTANGLSNSGAKVQNLLANPVARTTSLLAAETAQ